MIVVSDTSPILNLAAVSKLYILRELYAELIVPPAVRNELSRNGIELDPSWMRVVEAHDRGALRELLDLGEAEAIVVVTTSRPIEVWKLPVFSVCSLKPRPGT